MKSLPTYINERLIITNKKLTTPHNKQELVDVILDHFNNGNGDLNDIDVSKLDKKDFYRLFYNLIDELEENKITEIDISNWNLKELYCDEDHDSGMFEWCDTLESIILPDELKVIGKFTFYNCKKLKNIIVPDSVTFIGKHAFYGCDKLTVIVPNERVKKLVKNSGFKGEIIIKNNSI